ncbi:MAG: PD-(D/E)XK nuclease family protein [Gammaproteobacteria bacterium]|nr:PD-(D/E)XK nuclease family protein [Gammaproteobacteria bacterium]
MTDIICQLNASAAHEWLNCALCASDKHIRKRRVYNDYETVAQRFGNLVHEEITGEEMDYSKPVEYDKHTLNEKQLDYQYKTASDLLDDALNIIEQDWPQIYFNTTYKRGAKAKTSDGIIKVVGICDVVMVNDNDEAHIVDIKTGSKDLPNYYTPQLAIYCWLMSRSTDSKLRFEPAMASLLHVNRSKLYDLSKAVTLFTRPSKPLIEMGQDIITHVMRSVHNPVANPGTHCEYCESTDCVYHPEWDLTNTTKEDT